MTEIKGIAQAIEEVNDNDRLKKVLTLALGKRGLMFIEFQGRSRCEVDGLKCGQKVSVKIVFNGKTSRLGRRYNNIIGKSIKQI